MQKDLYSSQIKQVLNLLRDMRHKSGYTQIQLSELLNKPQSFVSKYESGERRLDIIELKIICESLGFTLQDLVMKI